MPHLHWLMRRGITYSQAFVGQEIANTPPSHATIGTGVFPRRHGIMGFWWKDPATGRMTRPTDSSQVENGALERVLSERHVPSLAAAARAANSHNRVLSVAGHKCYASDAMGTPAADYILCGLIYHSRWVAQAVGQHRPPPGAINNSRWDVPIPAPSSGFAPAVEQWKIGTENAWTTRYALWAFHRIHYPRIMMLTLPETDVLGHFAPDSRPVMSDLMRGFDKELGQVIAAYRRAGILNRTDFVVTADHGMSPVQARLPFSVLDDAIRAAGATKVFAEADSAASIGIREPSKARAVARNVAALGGYDVDATYYKTFSHGHWAYRPAVIRSYISPELRRAYLSLANTSASDSGPDVIVDYAPFVTTGDRLIRGYHWVGAHLGPGWDDQHIPLIIAGSGIRRGSSSSYPARLIDIAPTVAGLLGLHMGNVDGHVLQDALRHPNKLALQRQRSRGKPLRAMVSALQARSAR